MIVQAVESRPQPSVRLMPGVVSSVGATVDVVMDGDPDGVVVQAAPLFADLSVADRVMVLFDPPRGVFVVGTIGRAHEAGTVILRRDLTDDLNDESVSVVVPNVQFYFGRQYRLRTRLNAIWASGGLGPEEVVSCQSQARYYGGIGTDNFLLIAFGYVHGVTTQGSTMSMTKDIIFVPPATFVTDWTWDISVTDGGAQVRVSLEVTDVGPAPPQV